MSLQAEKKRILLALRTDTVSDPSDWELFAYHWDKEVRDTAIKHPNLPSELRQKLQKEARA